MKNNKDLINSTFKLLKSVGDFAKGNVVKVTLYDSYLTLSNFLVKHPTKLNYSQITDVFFGLATVSEKPKMSTVITRVATGAVFFGDLGSVIGAFSANGKKKKTVFVVSYISSKGEKGSIFFENIRLYKGKKLSEKLKELCNINSDKTETMNTL